MYVHKYHVVCICIHTHIHNCTYICTCAHTTAWVLYTFVVYPYIRTYICTYGYTNVWMEVHSCICMHVRKYMHTCCIHTIPQSCKILCKHYLCKLREGFPPCINYKSYTMLPYNRIICYSIVGKCIYVLS